MKSTYIYTAMVGLVILLMVMQGGFADKVKPGTTVYAENPLASKDNIATARISENSILLSWPGTLTAKTETHLAPQVTGRIKTITVLSGDKVRKGQVLAGISAHEMQARVAAARAALVRAEAESVRTHVDDQRTRTLYQGDAATRQELDASTAAAARTAAQVTEAREGLRAVEAQLADTVITAPYDAYVVRREQEPGDMALPGKSILTLQDMGHLEMEASIPTRCNEYLQQGQAVTIKLMNTDQQWAAEISEIQPAADPATHTLRIKARVADATGLRPGTAASLQLRCGNEKRLLVPEIAVTRIGQLETVQWLNAEGMPRLRHVRTGKREGHEVEILSGLEPGDRVVLRPGVHP